MEFIIVKTTLDDEKKANELADKIRKSMRHRTLNGAVCSALDFRMFTALPHTKVCGFLKRCDIIKNKLGACAQIYAANSIYYWKDKLENTKEFIIEIKTTHDKYKKLQEFIVSNSSYELPEVIAIKITEGYNKYLNWIGENLR